MKETELQTCLRSMGEQNDPPLPNPGLIWFRAELQRRLAAEERAVRPVRIVERLACAACLLAAVVIAAVKF